MKKISLLGTVVLAGLLLAVAPAARADAPWGATFSNHLSLQLGCGYGTLNMGPGSSEAAYVDAFNKTLPSQGLPGPIAGAADPQGELHVALTFTYYFPYYITLRTGAEVAFFEPTEQSGSSVITNYGGTAMIPVLIGPHLSLLDDKLVLELLVGPTFTVYTSNGLNAPSQVDTNVQLDAGLAVGVDSVLGAHYFLSRIFAVGVELGYRSLVSPPVHADSSAGTYTFGTLSSIDLDFSGFRAVGDLAILLM